MITLDHIDGGAPFDWGRTSDDYAQFRDIYPPAFYQHILDKGLCTAGQIVLDLGTGTGVLPRNLYAQGAKWETEHRAMLEQLAPPSFDVLHFVATAELKPKQ